MSQALPVVSFGNSLRGVNDYMEGGSHSGVVVIRLNTNWR